MEIQEVERKKQLADDSLKDKKKEAGKISRELAKLEQDIREQETEMGKKHPVFIKTKEKVDHTQKKLNNAMKTLEQARRADEAHQADIKKLEMELESVEKIRNDFENEIAGESHRRGSNLHLEEDLVQEYDRLKQKADATATNYLSNLDSVNREQKSDQDKLDHEINKKAHIEELFKQKSLEKEEALKRRDKLMDHIR